MSKKARQFIAVLAASTLTLNSIPIYANAPEIVAPVSADVVIDVSEYSGITFNSLSPNIAYKLHDKDNYSSTTSWESVPEGTYIRLVGDGVTPEAFRVVFEAARNYNLKLEDVVLDFRDEVGGDAPIVIGKGNVDSNVTIQLVGDNKIYANDGNAGIELQGNDAKVTIEDDPTDNTKGSLDVSGGSNASAIGQGKDNYIHIGEIAINSGKVVARGGSNSGAIGAHNVIVDKITIAGGDVTAIAHEDGGIPIGTCAATNTWNIKELIFSGGSFVGIGGSGDISNAKGFGKVIINNAPDGSTPNIQMWHNNADFRQLFVGSTIENNSGKLLVTADFIEEISDDEDIILKSIDGNTEFMMPKSGTITGFTTLLEDDIYEIVKKDANEVESLIKVSSSGNDNDNTFIPYIMDSQMKDIVHVSHGQPLAQTDEQILLTLKESETDTDPLVLKVLSGQNIMIPMNIFGEFPHYINTWTDGVRDYTNHIQPVESMTLTSEGYKAEVIDVSELTAGVTLDVENGMNVYRIGTEDAVPYIGTLEFVGTTNNPDVHIQAVNGDHTVIIDNVTIDHSSEAVIRKIAPIAVANGSTESTLTVALKGKNIVKGSHETAGVALYGGITRNIKIVDYAGDDTIGELEAYGRDRASGIGNGLSSERNLGTIYIGDGSGTGSDEIKGGVKVTAYGASEGAGIGGSHANMEGIIINNAHVEAYGGSTGVAIGTSGTAARALKNLVITDSYVVGSGGKNGGSVTDGLISQLVLNGDTYIDLKTEGSNTRAITVQAVENNTGKLFMMADFDTAIGVGEEVILKPIDGDAPTLLKNTDGMLGTATLVESDIYELVKKNASGTEIPLKGSTATVNTENRFIPYVMETAGVGVSSLNFVRAIESDDTRIALTLKETVDDINPIVLNLLSGQKFSIPVNIFGEYPDWINAWTDGTQAYTNHLEPATDLTLIADGYKQDPIDVSQLTETVTLESTNGSPTFRIGSGDAMFYKGPLEFVGDTTDANVKINTKSGEHNILLNGVTIDHSASERTEPPINIDLDAGAPVILNIELSGKNVLKGSTDTAAIHFYSGADSVINIINEKGSSEIGELEAHGGSGNACGIGNGIYASGDLGNIFIGDGSGPSTGGVIVKGYGSGNAPGIGVYNLSMSSIVFNNAHVEAYGGATGLAIGTSGTAARHIDEVSITDGYLYGVSGDVGSAITTGKMNEVSINGNPHIEILNNSSTPIEDTFINLENNTEKLLVFGRLKDALGESEEINLKTSDNTKVLPMPSAEGSTGFASLIDKGIYGITKKDAGQNEVELKGSTSGKADDNHFTPYIMSSSDKNIETLAYIQPLSEVDEKITLTLKQNEEDTNPLVLQVLAGENFKIPVDIFGEDSQEVSSWTDGTSTYPSTITPLADMTLVARSLNDRVIDLSTLTQPITLQEKNGQNTYKIGSGEEVIYEDALEIVGSTTNPNVHIYSLAGNPNIILNNVTIDHSKSGTTRNAPITIANIGERTSTIELKGISTLKGSSGSAGIQLYGGTDETVQIIDHKGDGSVGTLEVYGTGNAAGIGTGTNSQTSIGSIVIGDGTEAEDGSTKGSVKVIAYGAGTAPGIGASRADVNAITLNNAHVETFGGENGSSIGTSGSASRKVLDMRITDGYLYGTGGSDGVTVARGTIKNLDLNGNPEVVLTDKSEVGEPLKVMNVTNNTDKGLFYGTYEDSVKAGTKLEFRPINSIDGRAKESQEVLFDYGYKGLMMLINEGENEVFMTTPLAGNPEEGYLYDTAVQLKAEKAGHTGTNIMFSGVKKGTPTQYINMRRLASVDRTYTVVFHENREESQSKYILKGLVGHHLALASQLFDEENGHIAFWSTNPDGSGEVYPTNNIPSQNSNIEVYAQWRDSIDLAMLVDDLYLETIQGATYYRVGSEGTPVPYEGRLYITSSDSTANDDNTIVMKNGNHEIVLSDVRIEAPAHRGAIEVLDGTLTIDVKGTNYLAGGGEAPTNPLDTAEAFKDGRAAIDLASPTANVVINGDELVGDTLQVRGGFNQPGIGTSISAGGDITINGGNIIARSYQETDLPQLTVVSGAPIGAGGYPGTGIDARVENIIINGGNIDVRQTSDYMMAAGIGSSPLGSVGTIQIHDGMVNVVGSYSSNAALIGGAGADVDQILITGGEVNAIHHNGENAAAIGAGGASSIGSIEITGGAIKAIGSSDATAIGASKGKFDSNVSQTVSAREVIGTTALNFDKTNGKVGEIKLSGNPVIEAASIDDKQGSTRYPVSAIGGTEESVLSRMVIEGSPSIVAHTEELVAPILADEIINQSASKLLTWEYSEGLKKPSDTHIALHNSDTRKIVEVHSIYDHNAVSVMVPKGNYELMIDDVVQKGTTTRNSEDYVRTLVVDTPQTYYYNIQDDGTESKTVWLHNTVSGDSIPVKTTSVDGVDVINIERDIFTAEHKYLSGFTQDAEGVGSNLGFNIKVADLQVDHEGKYNLYAKWVEVIDLADPSVTDVQLREVGGEKRFTPDGGQNWVTYKDELVLTSKGAVVEDKITILSGSHTIVLEDVAIETRENAAIELLQGHVVLKYTGENQINAAQGAISMTSGSMTLVGDTTQDSLTLEGAEHAIDGVGEVAIEGKGHVFLPQGTHEAIAFKIANDADTRVDAGTIPNKAYDMENRKEIPWGGIFYENNIGGIAKSMTFTEDYTIPEGKTFIIPKDVTLTIDRAITLENNGTLRLEEGTLSSRDSLVGEGLFETVSMTNRQIQLEDVTYTGLALEPNITITSQELYGKQFIVDPTVLYSEEVVFENNIEAGTDTAQVTYVAKSGLVEDNIVKTFSIQKAEPTIEVEASAVVTYSLGSIGQEVLIQADIKGVADEILADGTITITQNGEVVASDIAYTGSPFTYSYPVEVGGEVTVEVEYTPASTGDDINYKTGVGATTFVIDKHELDPTMIPEATELTVAVDGESYTATIDVPSKAPTGGYSDYEYSFDGTNWSKENTLQGIAPNEVVTGYIRYAGTTTLMPSLSVATNTVTTQARPKTPEVNGETYFETATEVTLASTEDVAIYYTLDKSDPKTSKTRMLYTGPIKLEESTYVSAVAYKEGAVYSETATQLFERETKINGKPQSPTILGTDNQDGTMLVQITGVIGSKIYYTTDGTEPTEQSPLYVDGIVIDDETTIKAIQVNERYTKPVSTVAWATLRPNARKTVTVIGGIGSGSYAEGDTVEVVANVPEGKIFTRFVSNDVVFENEASPKTTFIMPAHNVEVTAEYVDADAEAFIVTVKNGQGTGNYIPGQIVTLAATVNPGDVFVAWEGLEGVTFVEGTDTNSRMVKFVMPERPLAVTATTRTLPTATHQVVVGKGIGSGFYREGDTVTLVADKPEEGQSFVGWIGLDGVTFVGDTSSASEMVQFIMPSAGMIVSAGYVELPPVEVVTYEVFADLSVAGEVVEGLGNYEAGEKVVVSVQIPEGYTFSRWVTTDVTLEDPTQIMTSFQMPEGKVVLKAELEKREAEAQYTLGVTNGFGDGAYTPNTVVDIIADVPDGKRFVEWKIVSGEGQILNKTSPTTIVATGTTDTVIEAVFEDVISYTLTVHGGEGSGTYEEGEEVTITASPAVGQSFIEWIEGVGQVQIDTPITTGSAIGFAPTQTVTGTSVSDKMTYTFKMPNKNYTLTASYEADADAIHQVTVSGGQGSGHYSEGATVTLTADVPEGSHFTGWNISGVTVSNTNSSTITFVMPAGNVTVEAQYEVVPTFDVTFGQVEGVTYEGAGNYKVGEEVTVSASLSKGYIFMGWTATGITLKDEEQAIITFIMPEGPVELTATFEEMPITATEKVTVTGGFGSGYYEEGEAVALHADVPEGKTFVGWTVADDLVRVEDKTNPSTTFIMGSQPVTITANYIDTPIERTYKVVVEGATGGGDYHAGEQVVILPSAPEGQVFVGWEVRGVVGVDLSNPVLTFSMPTGEVRVTALFESTEKEVQYHTVEVINGMGGGDYVVGDHVTLIANTINGQIFTDWDIEGVEVEDPTSTTISFTMPNNPVSAKANYKTSAFETTAKPVITANATTFIDSTEVVIEGEKDALIYYTLDGTTPSQSSTLYTGPITLTDTTTVKAIAIVGGKLESEVSSATFVKGEEKPETVAKPVMTPNGGRFITSMKVELLGEEGTSIYYTTNGTTPTVESTRYTGPLTLTKTTTLMAIAVKDGVISDVTTARFTKQNIGSSGSSSSSNSSSDTEVTTTTTVEEIISALSEAEKEAIAENIQENMPYTSLAGELTVELLDTLTNDIFTEDQLLEILADDVLLSALGLNEDTLSKQIGLTPVADASFYDVDDSHWASVVIKMAAEIGLIQGNPDGTFEPERPLFMADTFTFLDRVLLLKGIDDMNLPRSVVETFITDKDHWAFSHMASIGSRLSVETLQTLSMYGDRPITRELLAQILFETLGGRLETIREGIQFSDTYASPYQQAIDFCVRTGLLVGTSEETMSPEKPVTRAEMAMITMRAINLLSIAEANAAQQNTN